MGVYAALDVSQELTAIYVVDDGGALLAEGKVATCPDAIATWLGRWPSRPSRRARWPRWSGHGRAASGSTTIDGSTQPWRALRSCWASWQR